MDLAMPGAVDAVCNLMTSQVLDDRPEWTRRFLAGKVRADDHSLAGLNLEQHLELLDEAGIERALLIAPKMGRLGLPGSWQMDPQHVAEAVQSHPDRFSGLIGMDPYAGMAGVAELERYVREYGFVGAHLYPHWFELPPDDARYYPLYAKCAELGVPVQIQVGHCLRYTDEQVLPSVGRPITLDTIACHFPELVLIGIHTGWPWTEEMISVAYKHPNVYIGTDAYAPRHWDSKLVHYINSWGQDKVLFGTDWPVIAHRRAREEIDGLGLRPQAARKLLRDNAIRIYKLPDKHGPAVDEAGP